MGRLPQTKPLPQLAPEARALLDDILAAPDDDEPRRVYADWLLKRDDPRGELITVQCELAQLEQQPDPPAERMQRLQARAKELLHEHRESWIAPLRAGSIELVIGESRWVRGNPTHWTFARGFVDWVTMNVSDFIAAGARLLQREPVRRVRLTSVGRAVAFLEVPGMERLQELDLSNNRLYKELAQGLVQARLPAMQELDLRGCKAGPQSMKALAQASPERWPALRRLNLMGNPLKDSGGKALAATSVLQQLEQLELLGCKLGPAAIAALAARPMPRLRRLNLRFNPMGPAGARALVGAPWLRQLQQLNLMFCDLEPSQIESIRAQLPAAAELVLE